jgi:hypothetical protein
MKTVTFSFFASRIAQNAAGWAADCLDAGEVSRDMDRSSVERFLANIRYFLDRIEEESGKR